MNVFTMEVSSLSVSDHEYSMNLHLILQSSYLLTMTDFFHYSELAVTV